LPFDCLPGLVLIPTGIGVDFVRSLAPVEVRLAILDPNSRHLEVLPHYMVPVEALSIDSFFAVGEDGGRVVLGCAACLLDECYSFLLRQRGLLLSAFLMS
jgi:hypothetical protein